MLLHFVWMHLEIEKNKENKFSKKIEVDFEW